MRLPSGSRPGAIRTWAWSLTIYICAQQAAGAGDPGGLGQIDKGERLYQFVLDVLISLATSPD